MNHLPPAYFEAIYARDPDPWGFDSRWYEQRKYDLTLAALPRARYRRGFEPGCANGSLTQRLAERCDWLIAADLLPSVVENARARLREANNAEVRLLAVPDAWPDESFDLVVLSEVGYYLYRPGLNLLLRKLEGSLLPAGHLISIHWKGRSDHPLTAADVHAALDASSELTALARYEERDFLLSVHERRGP